MKFYVTIEETLAKTIEVEADNYRAAYDQIYKAYCDDGTIVLGADDYSDTEFMIEDEEGREYKV